MCLVVPHVLEPVVLRCVIFHAGNIPQHDAQAAITPFVVLHALAMVVLPAGTAEDHLGGHGLSVGVAHPSVEA
jgi:hypothetical protein